MVEYIQLDFKAYHAIFIIIIIIDTRLETNVIYNYVRYSQLTMETSQEETEPKYELHVMLNHNYENKGVWSQDSGACSINQNYQAFI